MSVALILLCSLGFLIHFLSLGRRTLRNIRVQMLVLSSKPLKITDHTLYFLANLTETNITHSIFFDYYKTMTCKYKFNDKTIAVSLHSACFSFNCELTFLSSLDCTASIVVYVCDIIRRCWMQRTCLL